MRRRDKSKHGNSRLPSSQSLKSKGTPSEPFLEAFEDLLQRYADEHGLDFHEVVHSIRIPVKVFTDRRLGPLEAVSLYLRDEHGYTYAEMAKLLNRDSRTIWTACNRAGRKLQQGGKAQ